MNSLSRRSRVLAVGVCCAAAGTGAGAIATAGAASKPQSAGAHHARHGHAAVGGKLLRRAVHGSFVVHTKAGYRTVTVDRGRLVSVDGQKLTIAEGTPKAAYKTVTLTIPAGAKVRSDRKAGSLADLKAGQRVVVVQAPQRTLVAAHAAKAG